MQFTAAELLALFFIYSFLGWCAEVAFAAIKHGKFVNRGFLNGPVCPIYGFGVVACIIALTPVSEHIAVLFFASMLLTSALEFLTGWALEKLFHAKWWDYSGERFNIKGYICLEFSIIWGFAATFIMKLVHPMILSCVQHLPQPLLLFLLAFFSLLIILDLAATFTAVRDLQKRLALLEKAGSEMHGFSNKIGGTVADATIAVKGRADETAERYGDYIAQVRENRTMEKALAEAHRAEEKALAEAHRAEELSTFRAARAEGRAAGRLRAEAFRDNLSSYTRRYAMRILFAFPSISLPQDPELFRRLRESFEKHRKS